MRCRAFDHINFLIKKLKYKHDCQEWINIKALENTDKEIKIMMEEERCKQNI